ncbi:MAG TPA: hypothetical protein VES39_07225, partial [Rhodospirillales bacterium]|nr:hypothetical protein [Rhodospirillales bacterium]
DPLIGDLLRRGFARPDPLGLGLEVSEQGALLNASGQPSHRLFALGPVTRGSFWEIVAVPDIRMHSARLAGHLLAQMQEPGGIDPAFRPSRRVAAAPSEEAVSDAVPPRLAPAARKA